jgi:D-alanyl-D-alanine carboxypeptidase (penicillin-binding protein 5/6)
MRREGQTTRRARDVRGTRGPRAAIALFAALLVVAGGPSQAAAAEGPPPAPPPSAPSAIVIDRVTGRVLYGKGIHAKRPMASTTKIMTALLAIERLRKLERRLTAPSSVAHISGIGLEPGDRITVRQALLGLMLKSAQDCGLTLACGVAGSESRFVGLMNARSRKIGLRDTRYRNSTGSHRDARHYSSVSDLSRLARIAMRNATFRDIVRRQHATIRWDGYKALEVTCNNLLLHWDWADGIKCGYTGAAGFCLVGAGQPGLRPFITATLASPRRDQEARDHVALFQWASALYEEKTVVTAGDVVASVPLTDGGEVRVAAKTALTAVVRSAAPVRPTFTLPASFSVRPADDTVVGSVVYLADGVKLGTVRLVVVPAPPSPSPEATATGTTRALAAAAPETGS